MLQAVTATSLVELEACGEPVAAPADSESDALTGEFEELERRYGQPVSAIRAATLSRANLSDYDVIVLPHSQAGYSGMFDAELGFGEILAEQECTWFRDFLRAQGVYFRFKGRFHLFSP